MKAIPKKIALLICLECDERWHVPVEDSQVNFEAQHIRSVEGGNSCMCGPIEQAATFSMEES